MTTSLIKVDLIISIPAAESIVVGPWTGEEFWNGAGTAPVLS